MGDTSIQFDDGDPAAHECLKEYTSWAIGTMNRYKDVQRCLLASGFEVPDHWLGISTGTPTDSWKKGQGKRISYTGLDAAAFKRAARESHVAFMRLEATAATSPTSNRRRKKRDDIDPAKDARIAKGWDPQKYGTKQEYARTIGEDQKYVVAALERNRKARKK
jgi:hypothetical protein